MKMELIGVFFCSFTESSPARFSHQYWAPVVANHFPSTSPFIQTQSVYGGYSGYSMLPQGIQFSPPPRISSSSHQALSRQRSGGASGDYTLLPQTPKLERKRSKKAVREVSINIVIFIFYDIVFTEKNQFLKFIRIARFIHFDCFQ